MACNVNLTGKVTVGGDGCGCAGTGGGPTKQQPLAFACAGQTFPATVSTDCPTQISTVGIPGASWADLPGSDSVGDFQLLVVTTKSPMILRIGADVARLVGSGGTFPTGFAGGETFAFDVDSVSVAVAFTAAAQSLQQVITEINQAAVGAGLDFLPASVDPTTGQLRLNGKNTGDQGAVAITTPNATIGFAAAGSASGEGSDIHVNGLFMAQFDAQNAPERVQISGSGQVEVLAAGAAV